MSHSSLTDTRVHDTQSLNDPPTVNKNLAPWLFGLNCVIPGSGTIIAGAARSDVGVVVIGILQLIMAGAITGYILSVLKHGEVPSHHGPTKFHFKLDWNLLYDLAALIGWIWSISYGYKMWQKSKGFQILA